MTLARPLTFRGKGLHSGVAASVTLSPGVPGMGLGIVIGGRLARAADLDADGEGRATRIADRASGASVSGIEHVLAALAGTGQWDVVVEVAGGEPPALDGSALPFAEAIAGAAVPGPEAGALAIGERIEISVRGSRAVAAPCAGLVLEVAIEFDNPWIGRQGMAWIQGERDFVRELAPARTFGFAEEAGALHARGLALGADLGNALVIGPGGPVNPGGARFPDEPVRHKTLDLLGDLALLGRPIRARIEADRPSHALNLELVRAIGAAAARHSSLASIP